MKGHHFILSFFQSQQHDHDDELNGKLTDYLQKLEDMTHQLGDINSRLQECEDNKVGGVSGWSSE